MSGARAVCAQAMMAIDWKLGMDETAVTIKMRTTKDEVDGTEKVLEETYVLPKYLLGRLFQSIYLSSVKNEW